MEALMATNTHVILDVSRTSTTNANQTPQSAISNRLSVPSGSQVIELDSEDEDEDEDDERTLQFGFNDAEYSDEYSDDEDEEDRMFEQRRQNILDAQRNQALRFSQNMRAAAPVAPPRPVVPYRPGEVVDLLSDDDEPPRAAAPIATTGRPPTAPVGARPGVPAPLARSATQPTTTSSTSAAPGSAVRSQTAATLARAASTPTTTVQPRITGGKRIIETPSPDATVAEPAKRRKITVNGVEIKLEFEPKKFGEANVTDEVIEVLGEEDEPAAE
eukprot:gene30747-34699_t